MCLLFLVANIQATTIRWLQCCLAVITLVIDALVMDVGKGKICPDIDCFIIQPRLRWGWWLLLPISPSRWLNLLWYLRRYNQLGPRQELSHFWNARFLWLFLHLVHTMLHLLHWCGRLRTGAQVFWQDWRPGLFLCKRDELERFEAF